MSVDQAEELDWLWLQSLNLASLTREVVRRRTRATLHPEHKRASDLAQVELLRRMMGRST